MRKLIAPTFWLLLVVCIGTWITLTLYFSPALPVALRGPAAAITGAILLLSFFRWKQRMLLRILTIAIFCVGGALWAGIRPSNDRAWVPEVKSTPWADVNGDLVTIHNVRNFKYRTENDFDAVYDTRTFNVQELTEVDMVVTYWAGKPIAHLMVSFGFNNRDFIAFSIETRKEVGEAYSAVNGFFRNYELTYVVADERDVIGVRTNYRVPEERVYVLRTRMALQNGRKLFLEYIRRINKLKDQPAFYNTLTTNCTTQVLDQVKSFGGVANYTWKILLSGYVPDYLYETDTLMPGMSFEDIMSQSLVNERAKKNIDSPNFSELIREGVPHPEPRATPLAAR
ncbi:MAG: hypothetical protein RL326_2225 [Pseudomonadota bacterium]|jgi:hypothetical protein